MSDSLLLRTRDTTLLYIHRRYPTIARHSFPIYARLSSRTLNINFLNIFVQTIAPNAHLFSKYYPSTLPNKSKYHPIIIFGYHSELLKPFFETSRPLYFFFYFKRFVQTFLVSATFNLFSTGFVQHNLVKEEHYSLFFVAK